MQVGSDDNDNLTGASADAEESFFLAGYTDGSFDGVTANEDEGTNDFVVAKVDSHGSLLWSWQVRVGPVDSAAALGRASICTWHLILVFFPVHTCAMIYPPRTRRIEL